MATMTTEETPSSSSSSSLPYYDPRYQLPEQMVASPEELMANDELMDFMVNICSGHLFDTKEGSERRKRVIDKLSAMLQAWAIEVGTAKEISEEHLLHGGGIQIQIFGSTKLEVHNIDSDIDMLCMAPSYVTRGDFFVTFKQKLVESADVENLLAIPEAYTPVIKFIMDGQPVDMVFASLQAPALPIPVDALDLRWLTGLDEQSVRSLNGVRVAQWICKLVPDLYSFRITLRVIKFWAKQRGLYSNILGFLGGVNYALLVALVCQTFPELCPYSLVRKFFAMYTMWSWPTPVMLRRFEDLQFKDSDGRYLPVWNPLVNFKDSLHIMPIITPAYPAMNSAYNIAQPQFRCIMDEFVRGQVMFQSYPYSTGFPWNTLFQSSTEDFFQKYPRYIQIDISAKKEEEHRIWFGWVESRIRMLILALEQPPSIFCHPIANCFHRQPEDSIHDEPQVPLADLPEEGEDVAEESVEEKSIAATTEESRSTVEHIYSTPKKSPTSSSDSVNKYISSFFIALSFRKDLMRADVSFVVKDFVQKVNSWANKTDTMELDIVAFDKTKVPSFVYKVKAEPSSVKSCTPKPLRQRRLSYSSGVPRLINGFVTYDASNDGSRPEYASPSRARAASFFGAASPRMPYHANVNNRAHSIDFTDYNRVFPAGHHMHVNPPNAGGYLAEGLRFDPNNCIRDEHRDMYMGAISGSPVRILPSSSVSINPSDYMQQSYSSSTTSPRYSQHGSYMDNNYAAEYNNHGGERRRPPASFAPPNTFPLENHHNGRAKQAFSAQNSPRSSHNHASSNRVQKAMSADAASNYSKPTSHLSSPVDQQPPQLINVVTGSVLQDSHHLEGSDSGPPLMFGSISADHEALQPHADSNLSNTSSSPKRTRKDFSVTPPPEDIHKKR